MTLQLIIRRRVAFFVLNFLHILAALSALVLSPILVCILLVHLLLLSRRKVSGAFAENAVTIAFPRCAAPVKPVAPP